MNRFTKKSNSIIKAIEYQLIDEKVNLSANEGIKKIPVLATNKLGKLEDIEEELGIDLITYFKIKVGTKVYSTLIIDDDLIIDNIFGSGKETNYHIVKRYSRSGFFVRLDEYGRNWALTEEELRNVN